MLPAYCVIYGYWWKVSKVDKTSIKESARYQCKLKSNKQLNLLIFYCKNPLIYSKPKITQCLANGHSGSVWKRQLFYLLLTFLWLTEYSNSCCICLTLLLWRLYFKINTLLPFYVDVSAIEVPSVEDSISIPLHCTSLKPSICFCCTHLCCTLPYCCEISLDPRFRAIS